MPVDVTTTTIIGRPRVEVAAFAAEPDNAPRWYVNIQQVEWVSAPPLAVGALDMPDGSPDRFASSPIRASIRTLRVLAPLRVAGV